MTTTKVRWGIIGAGIIAHKLADAVCLNADSELVAVASKTFAKAQTFADQYNIKAESDYQQLVSREDIDVIYIATTHNFHYENALLALQHHKHLLIEKPFTVNADQARQLIELAQQNQCFLMEAIWVRYLPSLIKLKSLIKQGIIGDIKLLNLTFGHQAPPMYWPRLVDPQLAGGVTLDMGIYPITFANFLMDARPIKVNSMCHFSDTGVDETAIYQFKYANQCMANINASFNLKTRTEAMIYGSKGYIDFPNFQAGSIFHVHMHNGTGEILSTETHDCQNHANGFIYQVAEVVRCLHQNVLESPTITLQETLETMALMDHIRASWGFKYPFE